MELMLSTTCKQVTDRCDMRENSLALDYQLQRRQPCCYGENVDCDLCAALTPFAIAARAEAGADPPAVSGFVPVARRRS